MRNLFTMFTGREYVLLFLGFAFVLFFSSFHLFVSPETWLDEGLIIQSADGLLHTGKAALPVAPHVYEPAWYITTGFPLTVPLALVGSVFGVSLYSARIVMLLFLLCFFAAAFWYAQKAIGGRAAWLGFFFLVFFAPIYGHGRNALGEIPGLLWMLVALMPLIDGGALTRVRALLVGLGTGLAFSAKPIFLLFIPALFVACALRHRELNLRKVAPVLLAGLLLPIATWLYTQFDGATISRVLSVYANPHDLDVWKAVQENIVRFLTESQPLYFLGALGLWLVSYVLRRVRQVAIPLVEEALLFFSILIFLAYLRNAGYYRYFFPGQVFAVLYLPKTIEYLVAQSKPFVARIALGFVLLLLAFQMYETGFRSWTAVHYDSKRTEALQSYVENLPAGESIFVYQAPEVLPFTAAHPTYQFVQITPSIKAGEAYQSQVTHGTARHVITPTDFFTPHAEDIFSKYAISSVLDAYVILTPRELQK